MKIIRTSTIGLSLNIFCKGLFKELATDGFDIMAISSPDTDLEEVERREGIKTIGVAMERKISPIKDIKSLVLLIKVIRKEKPDMVHSITPKAGLLSMIAAKIAKVPVRVHTFTGLIFPTSSGLKRKLLMATDRMTCRCATHVMAEGTGIRTDLVNNGITNKDITVLGYGNLRGIDLNYYCRTPDVITNAEQLRDKLLGNSETRDLIHDTPGYLPFVFVFIGRFVADKGIDMLIQAFSILRHEGKNIKLIMAGDFEEDDPLKPETLTYMKNSKDILISPGWIKDIRPYLAAADALVFPSRREGFPNVVLEAGALGLPAIVTDINGSREIITDELNGRIVPPDNKDALIKAMRDFVDKQDKTNRMASHARQIIEDRYEQSFVRNNLKRCYLELLSGNNYS